MSQTQLNRFTTISKLIDGHVTIAEAAASLGISQRQIIRLKKGVMTEGQVAASLGIHYVFFLTTTLLLLNAFWVYTKVCKQLTL